MTLPLPQGKFYYEARFNRISDSRVITVLRDVTELKARQNEIEYMSYHDHLTDIYNRRFFEEELERLDTDRNYPLTIAVIDINGLKLVNDAFGHTEGDHLIKVVARCIKSECRIDDIVARTGGDEFVVLLPKTSKEDAQKLMSRINEAVDTKRDRTYCISIAIGCVTKNSKHQVLKDVIIKAEEKMYRNKISESQLMRFNTIKSILSKLNRTVIGEETHCTHSIDYCKSIGMRLNFDKEMLEELEQLAIVHDIGKIAISPEILNKKEELTTSEYEIIKRHPEIGYQILKATDAYASIAEYVLYHHEHWDGNGYPKGLKGEEIPRFARILSVVEAFDAMISKRPYKDAITVEEALQELKDCAGTQFDPFIVSIFTDYVYNDLAIRQ